MLTPLPHSLVQVATRIAESQSLQYPHKQYEVPYGRVGVVGIQQDWVAEVCSRGVACDIRVAISFVRKDALVKVDSVCGVPLRSCIVTLFSSDGTTDTHLLIDSLSCRVCVS